MIPLKQRLTYLLLIGAVIVLLDQATKYLVIHYLTHRIFIIPGMLDLVSVYNRGAAFGMFNTGTCVFKTSLLAGISVIVFLVLLFVYLFSKDITRLTMVSLSMIISGAAGNILDRIRLGYVVDFIDVYIKDVHWPAFNAADSAITIGAVLLALDLLMPGKKQ